jgi:protein SCO1/2
MRRRSLLLIAIVLVAAAIVAGLAWRAGVFSDQGQPSVGGPFELVDQEGRPVDEAVLKGKWSAVFFGFTYCPDVCPTTLQALAAAQDRLGAKAKDFQVVFISVDPERDTPQQLKAYLTAGPFPPGTIGLTGTPAQVAAAARAYRVFYQKRGEGTDYAVDHSTPVYLMDRKGRFSRILPYNLPPEALARQVSEAMRGG